MSTTMKVFFLCKRYYTNKDLLKDKFGRLYHLPVHLARLGASVSVVAVDYRNAFREQMSEQGVAFHTVPATPPRLPHLLFDLYRIARASEPDIVIASGDSHIGFIGKHLARRIRARFVYEDYDNPVFLV